MLRDSDEEKTFVLEMLGLDKSSDEDCDLVVNKVSDQYSASPPSFAQLDSGATKSISPRPDLFSYILRHEAVLPTAENLVVLSGKDHWALTPGFWTLDFGVCISR